VARETQPPSKVRPGYLVFALIVAWFVGFRTAHEGYVVVQILRDPMVGDSLDLPAPLRDALVGGILDAAPWALPVGLGQVFLGGLLALVSAVALFRGRLSVAFGLQVLAANAVTAVLAHWVGGPARRTLLDLLVKQPELFAEQLGTIEQGVATQAYEWAFHLGLVLQLLTLLALAVALTRRRARDFLARPAVPHGEQ
jgi:hypothetical protein